MTKPADVIKLARTFADNYYVEGPNNDTIFGKWWGANHQPWCAMFVSYVFNHAGAGSLIKGIQGPKGYASCTAAKNWFQAKKAWHPAHEAKAGDIVIFDWQHDGAVDHTGIVIKNEPAKRLMITVEGNTSSGDHGSQSNGEGVYVRTRPYTVIAGVGRPNWSKLVPKPSTTSTSPARPKNAAGK